jgi:hypothetical protein
VLGIVEKSLLNEVLELESDTSSLTGSILLLGLKFEGKALSSHKIAATPDET